MRGCQGPLERRAQEGLQQALQGHLTLVGRRIAVHSGDALVVPDGGATVKDRVKQVFLGAEIIVHQRGIDPGFAGHLADGHTIEAVLGEQTLAGVQNGVAGIVRTF